MTRSDKVKKWGIRLILIILGLLLAVVILVVGIYQIVNRTNGRLVSSGEQRRYLLYVPESYNPDVPTPLVISLHGFAEWPAHMMGISHWNTLADQYGFIVVYPSGTQLPLRWRAYGALDGEADIMQDVRFISDLMDKLATEYNVDPARIYVNGFSNGGGMAFVLACKLSERIAAMGSVAGAYLLPWEECDGSRAVPAIVFHGTADPIVPYQGGRAGIFHLPFPAIPDWVEAVSEHNGCDEAVLELPASGSVEGIQYTGCEADVAFYTIRGGGHTWPGGGHIPERIVGRATQEIDATQLIWEFFRQHRLDSVTGPGGD